MNEAEMIEHVVEPLPAVIRSDGFSLEQIKRAGNLAIYRKIKGPEYSGYEVVKVRVCKAKQINGYSYPDREFYPSSEEWGTYGWTYGTLEAAQAKFEALLEERLGSVQDTVSYSGNSSPSVHEELSAVMLGELVTEPERVIPGVSTPSRGISEDKEAAVIAGEGGSR